MKPGQALGALLVLMAIFSASAQNLGLGTGSHAASPSDSANDFKTDRQDETPAPRKSQLNKRLGLTARRNASFDPKVFEARGRELSGQFYEIGTSTNAKPRGGDQNAAGMSLFPQKNGSKQWLIWVGIAGLAGASAGVAGYFLMSNSHPASAPPDIPLNLSDAP